MGFAWTWPKLNWVQEIYNRHLVFYPVSLCVLFVVVSVVGRFCSPYCNYTHWNGKWKFSEQIDFVIVYRRILHKISDGWFFLFRCDAVESIAQSGSGSKFKSASFNQQRYMNSSVLYCAVMTLMHFQTLSTWVPFAIGICTFIQLKRKEYLHAFDRHSLFFYWKKKRNKLAQLFMEIF